MANWRAVVAVAASVVALAGCGKGDPGEGAHALARPKCTTSADCADGVFCNGVEVCVGGLCQAGAPVVCGDSVECTYDLCDEQIKACRNIPDHSQCPVGQLCDGGGCSAAKACTADADCDDHLACDGVERCVSGRCAASPAPACDDGVACTRDLCSETQGCVHVPVDLDCGWGMRCTPGTGCAALPTCDTSADCDDNVYCNGAERCDSGRCFAGARPDVSDAAACTVDLCDEITRLPVHLSDDSLCPAGEMCAGAFGCSSARCTQDAQCDDNVSCNGQERCVDSQCQRGTRPSCDDANAMTTDLCDEASARCVHLCTAAVVCGPTECGLTKPDGCGGTIQCPACGSGGSACGGAGQACCAGTCSQAGAACVNGLCVICGGAGETCCPGRVCTQSATTCGGAGTCVECGGPGQPVCCGQIGQFCCGTPPCAGNAYCDAFSRCAACGGLGEPCCPGSTCAAGVCANSICTATAALDLSSVPQDLSVVPADMSIVDLSMPDLAKSPDFSQPRDLSMP